MNIRNRTLLPLGNAPGLTRTGIKPTGIFWSCLPFQRLPHRTKCHSRSASPPLDFALHVGRCIKSLTWRGTLRAEKEKLRKNIAAMRAAANPDTDDDVAVDEKGAAPVSFFTPGTGRHLGPSLDEINKMRDEAFAARKAAKRPAATIAEDVATTSASAEPGSSDEAGLESGVGGADMPTLVQLKALDRYGVKRQDMPSTKIKATEMLRALREVDVANAMGCNLDKDDFRGGASRAEAERVVQHYTPSPEGQDIVGADKHLDFAYRGISSIRRAGALRSIEA